ncbi:MAG: alpha/beta fold hydrolase [Sphingomicrobium sp.]
MTGVATHHWSASDGVDLVWRETGAGRAVILLHGLFSSAEVNWINYGTAAAVAAAGYRVIMPDHRAHGSSARPHDPALYPEGILARDLAELVAHLGLTDFDLGGFSLGARTVVQAVGEGLRPSNAILAGMGLRGLVDWDKRQRFFVDAIAAYDTAKRGDPHWLAIQFMKTMKVDRDAAALVLQSFGDVPRLWLDAFTMPTLVLIGSEDEDNGSARELAAALHDAAYAEIPGTHMSCVTKPDLGRAIADFLRSAHEKGSGPSEPLPDITSPLDQ